MFDKHKHNRSLTCGEKKLAYSVFGDSLNTDTIRLKSAWWVLKGYAVSPNGNIYFHPKDWCKDFSQQNLSQRAWLIHELTHVWQVQHHQAVVFKAIFNRRYRYTIKPNKPFLHYGIEQQAKMVEDYYMARELGQDCTIWHQCQGFRWLP